MESGKRGKGTKIQKIYNFEKGKTLKNDRVIPPFFLAWHCSETIQSIFMVKNGKEGKRMEMGQFSRGKNLMKLLNNEGK